MELKEKKRGHWELDYGDGLELIEPEWLNEDVTKTFVFYIKAKSDGTNVLYNNGGENYKVTFTTGEGSGYDWRIKFSPNTAASVNLSGNTYTFPGDGERNPNEQIGNTRTLYLDRFYVNLILNEDVEIKNVSMLYKVYEEGTDSEWSEIDATSSLTSMQYKIETMIWERHVTYETSPLVNLNITEDLIQGKNYILEIMFRVEDTDNNCYTLLQDKEDGRICFTYLGPDIKKPFLYHPFIEIGKLWKVHDFSMGSHHTVTDYYFSRDKVLFERNGHSYEELCARMEDGEEEHIGGFREEGQKVYRYDEEGQTEYAIYDFSLEAGDTFYDARNDISYIVERTDQLIVNGDTLKALRLDALDGVHTAEWVEGIGNPQEPLKYFYNDTPVSRSHYTAYVLGSSYWPLTFGASWNGWWGTQLKQFGRKIYRQQTDSLTYDLVYYPEKDLCSLHVYGWQRISCGPNHYIYCITEPTEDIMVQRLKFKIEDLEPVADCKSAQYVSYSFPFFDKNKTYIITDKQGDHVVPVRQSTTYRHFIEEGKVWKVGWFPGGTDTAKKLDYYYFDGDTIINYCPCKKMMCRHEAAEGWGNTEPWVEYAGAVYEEERRVYCAFPESENLELLYDFSSAIGTTLSIHGGSCIIAGRGVSRESFFKGNYTHIALYQMVLNDATGMMDGYDFDFMPDHLNHWLEGVGMGMSPLLNCIENDVAGNYYCLMTCYIGDEVIYKHPSPNIVDGVTPVETDVKKQWLDFTHIMKPRPKAPRYAELREVSGDTDDEDALEELQGEYSAKELTVNLKTLSGPYTISLTDATGKEVYRKEVQTSSVIALNTDLTKYEDGRYTLTVENGEEQYVATLTLPLDDVAVRDIPNTSATTPVHLFDLTGRRLTALPAKGIYIRDGRKVLVK